MPRRLTDRTPDFRYHEKLTMRLAAQRGWMLPAHDGCLQLVSHCDSASHLVLLDFVPRATMMTTTEYGKSEACDERKIP